MYFVFLPNETLREKEQCINLKIKTIYHNNSYNCSKIVFNIMINKIPVSEVYLFPDVKTSVSHQDCSKTRNENNIRHINK